MSATIDPGQSAGTEPAGPPARSRGAHRGRTTGCAARHRPDRKSSAPPTNTAASVRRRLVGAVVMATATVTLLLAVPPLRGVARQIDAMNLVWVGVAVGLEV